VRERQKEREGGDLWGGGGERKIGKERREQRKEAGREVWSEGGRRRERARKLWVK